MHAAGMYLCFVGFVVCSSVPQRLKHDTTSRLVNGTYIL